MSGLDQRVLATVAATLKLPLSRVALDTRNEDLAAWDSLGQVNLMMALEQTFDIYIEVEDFDGLQSVAAILEYLTRKGVQ